MAVLVVVLEVLVVVVLLVLGVAVVVAVVGVALPSRRALCRDHPF